MTSDTQVWQQEHMVRTLVRTARAVRRHLKRTIADVPGGVTAWWVLRHLDHAGSQPQVVIANELGVPSSTLTARLEEMEGNGLITREPDAADKRRVVVALTAAGRAMRSSQQGRAEVDLAALLVGADTWDLDAFRRVILVLQSNLRLMGTDPELRGGGRGRAKRSGFGPGGNGDPDERGIAEAAGHGRRA